MQNEDRTIFPPAREVAYGPRGGGELVAVTVWGEGPAAVTVAVQAAPVHDPPGEAGGGPEGVGRGGLAEGAGPVTTAPCAGVAGAAGLLPVGPGAGSVTPPPASPAAVQERKTATTRYV